MTKITGLFVMFLMLMSELSADSNIFLPKKKQFPPDYWQDYATVDQSCLDAPDCNSITLNITWVTQQQPKDKFQQSHKIMLRKRFELLVGKQTCSHYISSDHKIFAGFRVCQSRKGTGMKDYTGTFFDADYARYDIMRIPGLKQHSITKVMLDKGKSYGDFGQSVDAAHLEAKDRALVAAAARADGQSQPPVFARFKKPTVELLVAVDEALAAYFRNKEDAIIKYIGMTVVTADALFSRMNVSLKLVGVRFLSKYNFVPGKPTSFAEYAMHCLKFIYMNVISYHGHEFGTRVRGVADSVVTMTQAFGRDHNLGLAGPRDPQVGGYALIKCADDALITTELKNPHRLHHFVAGLTIAHETGHIFFFEHPELSETECFTDRGNCIMAGKVFWTLPFWLRNETMFIHSSLNGSHEYLMQQNVFHSDVGTVKIRIISPEAMMGVWFVCGLALVFCLWAAMEFYVWRKKNPAAYMPLREQGQSDERKDV